jgi:hypothetical protein
LEIDTDIFFPADFDNVQVPIIQHRATHQMTISARSLILASLLASCSLPAFADDVVGMWSSTSREPGSLGSQWTFAQNGDVTHTFGVLADFKYEIDGSQIKLMQLTPDHSPTEEVSSQEFSIEGDTLTLNPSSPDLRQVMKRVGKRYKGAHSIVGAWTYMHQTGNPAVMQYSRDGTVLLSVPFRTLTGLYDVNESKLSVKFQGKKTALSDFRLPDNDHLILTNPMSKESGYLRFTY